MLEYITLSMALFRNTFFFITFFITLFYFNVSLLFFGANVCTVSHIFMCSENKQHWRYFGRKLRCVRVQQNACLPSNTLTHNLNLSPVNNLFLVPPVRWKGAGLSPQWSKCRLTAADSQSVLCRINLKDVLALGWSAADPSVTRTCRYLVLQLHKKNLSSL